MTAQNSHPGAPVEWLSLTALGRVYGISAVQCGRLLQSAGLRCSDGTPSPEALQVGLARPCHNGQNHRSALWSRGGCGSVLQTLGLESAAERRLVKQWADLLEALQQNTAAVSTSAEELASELPPKLVAPVNAALRQRGCEWQLNRRAARARASRSPARNHGRTHA